MRRKHFRLLWGVMSTLVLIGAVRAAEGSGQAVPRISFKGRTLDGQGNPVSDATVALYEAHYGLSTSLPEIELVGEVKTGPDGAFAFSRDKEADVYRQASVVARKQGYALGCAVWEMREGDQQSDIPLREPKELSGVIVDEGGTPIVDAEVMIAIGIIGDEQDRRYLAYYIAPQLLTVRTDSSGRFVFRNLPADMTCELLAKKSGRATVCSFDAATYAGEKCQYSPGQSGITLTMPAEAKIGGVVVEKTGDKPVAGATLVVQPSRRTLPFMIEPVTSAHDGTFLIGSLSADSYTLQLASQGRTTAEWVAEPVKVDLKAAETQSDIRLVVSKGAVIEVLVKEQAGGKPIAKVSLGVRDQTSEQYTGGVTDETGVARIRLPGGSYQFAGLYKEGYTRSEQTESFTIADGETKRFEMTLSGLPSVRGVVYDDAGKPLAGATVQMVPGGRGKDATSDAEGKFEVSWDPQGWSPDRTVFYVVGRHTDRNLAVAQPADEEAKQVELKLLPAATLTGQVVDPNKEPIQGAYLLVMLRASNWGSSFLTYRSIKTDAEGRFEVGAIPAEQRYTITASADGYGQTQTDLSEDQVTSGRVQTGVYSLDVANLAVTGVVVDSDGEPVSGARVSCYGGTRDNQPNRDTQTDTDGEFILDGVCAGRVRIQANARIEGVYTYGSIETEGGARDVRITIAERSSGSRYVPRRPAKLKGKPLPDLKKVGIELPAEAEDRMLLVCFWDMNQRPSRHCVGTLIRQADALSAKGVTILAVHAGKTEEGALDQWIEQSKPPFPVGRVADDTEKALFDWGTDSLPHLILTDRKHIVVGEGFGLLEELDERIEAASGR